MNKEIHELKGIVKTVTFFNEETGYFVVKVQLPNKAEKTVVGNSPSISVGEEIHAKGVWSASSWGPQLKATEVYLSPPSMVDAIEKYLANSVPGIGKGYAKKLVQELGDAVFDVIENTPEKLNGIKGIGPKRGQAIVEAYEQQRSIREIMVFLHRIGLSASKAKRVHDHYGEQAISKIKENPYILCKDIWGIGFSTADESALKQGIDRASDYRIKAGISHCLKEAETKEGSCGLPRNLLIEKTSEILGLDLMLIEIQLKKELTAGNLISAKIDDLECIFLPSIYFQEKFIARTLVHHASLSPVNPIKNLTQEINDAYVELGLPIDEQQRFAVELALSNQICVITGGPGTGKTTITRVILRVLENTGFTSIRLAAPTGKAANRMSEATSRPAGTLHRLLEFTKDGTFKFNEINPLITQALIIDEFSMVDVSMTSHICKALASSTRLIIIGDVDQLPSVGPGKVLSDIIESGVIPVAKLKKPFRQGKNSAIIANAHAVNGGQLPDIGWRDNDFFYNDISPKNPKSEEERKLCREQIEKEIFRIIKKMPQFGYNIIKDVQVLAPMKKGVLGVDSLNVKLQEMLNPHPDVEVEYFGRKWKTGDKVMQMRNNYDKEVFNGDVGYIVQINKYEKELTVSFDQLEVVYKFNELDELSLAYAFTIHKSQGSEFPVLIMPIDWSHYMMLKRNLVYTGITRSKKLCIMLGPVGAVKQAVETVQSVERYTLLKQWMQQKIGFELT